MSDPPETAAEPPPDPLPTLVCKALGILDRIDHAIATAGFTAETVALIRSVEPLVEQAVGLASAPGVTPVEATERALARLLDRLGVSLAGARERVRQLQSENAAIRAVRDAADRPAAQLLVEV